MNDADNKQRARGVDSLLNAETVKYFSMEAWEVDKYRESVLDYQGTLSIYLYGGLGGGKVQGVCPLPRYLSIYLHGGLGGGQVQGVCP